MNKISFHVMGKKGYLVLRNILEQNRYLISDVVASRDRGVDNDYFSEISNCCKSHGIKFHDRAAGTFSSIDHSGYIIAIGWRWMLNAGDKLIVIHDSLLPKYRGFAPLVNCLINGEDKIGATALFGHQDYDRGDIIAMSSRPIQYPMKITDAIDLMAEIYIELANEVLDNISLNECLGSMPQNEADATYSLWRDDQDYWIDWNQSALQIERFVDAVGAPYAGARCYVDEVEAVIAAVKELKDVQIADRQSSIGKVIFMNDTTPVVVCGSGLVNIIDMRGIAGERLLPLKNFRTRFSGKK